LKRGQGAKTNTENLTWVVGPTAARSVSGGLSRLVSALPCASSSLDVREKGAAQGSGVVFPFQNELQGPQQCDRGYWDFHLR
jgi:hypothetical protein